VKEIKRSFFTSWDVISGALTKRCLGGDTQKVRINAEEKMVGAQSDIFKIKKGLDPIAQALSR